MNTIANISEELNKTTKTDLLKIDPRSIIINYEKNPRQDYGDLEELKSSIKENGVRESIKIQNTKEGPELIHGFRRMTAVMQLIKEGFEIPRVPAIPVAKNYNENDSLFDHILCNSGKPLTLLEEALTYKSLIERGYTQTEIAKKIGKTQASVSNTLKLSELSKKVQNIIIKGKISSSLALEIAKSCDWDMEKTEEKLETAISTTSQEKKKVTAKHIDIQKPSKFKYVSKIVEKMKTEKIDNKKIEKVESLIKLLEEKNEEELFNFFKDL